MTVNWEEIMNRFMGTFMTFFAQAVLPLMMMMMFIRMMVSMISGMGRAFQGTTFY
jgi:hypothetical protein